MTQKTEVKAYVQQRVANALGAIIALYPAIGLLVSIANDRLSAAWPVISLTLLIAIFIWSSLRWGTFIAVDLRIPI
jgi:ABC-type transport system involved in cytochrome c biogenesis permease subunit